MVLHLEAGTCESQIDSTDVVALALECYQSRYYAYGNYNDSFRFSCPSCRVASRTMSGLLQHVESDYCGEALHTRGPLDKFLRFLESRIEAGFKVWQRDNVY